MTPEWRDEQRERPELPPDPSEQRYQSVWIDSGSGPGFEVLAPIGDPAIPRSLEALRRSTARRE